MRKLSAYVDIAATEYWQETGKAALDVLWTAEFFQDSGVPDDYPAQGLMNFYAQVQKALSLKAGRAEKRARLQTDKHSQRHGEMFCRERSTTMQVIVNLWHEQLHDLFVGTVNGRKLRLHIEADGTGYRLEGEFYETEDRSWYQVDFLKSADPDPAALLTACLENLNRAMLKKSDAIQDIHNTSSTPLVSVAEQQDILSKLGIRAEIRTK